MKQNTLILLVSFAFFSSAFAEKVGPLEVDVTVYTEPSATISKNSDFTLNLNESHVGIDVGNANLNKVINDFNVDPTNINFIFTTSVKISGIPAALGDYTKQKLDGKLDDRLAGIREATIPQIDQKVNAALAAAPGFSSLPEAAQDKIRNQTRDAAIEKLDAQLGSVRYAEAKEFSKRVNELQGETAIQEVAIGVGGVVGDGTMIIFARVGKFRVEMGPPTDENGQSLLDRIRPENSRIERANGTMGTGALDFGFVKNFDNNTSLRVDAYLYHDRLPYISGNELVADVLSLDAKDYDNHRQWWKIDSGAVRALLSTKNLDLYLGVASHDDGKFGVNGGALLRMGPDDTLIIDAFTGNRDFLRNGASVFYVHNLNPAFATYAGATYADHSWEPLLSDKPLDYVEGSVGVSYDVYKKLLRGGTQIKVGVSAEVAYRHYLNGDLKDEPVGRVKGGIEVSR